jgi:hypothetical protein
LGQPSILMPRGGFSRGGVRIPFGDSSAENIVSSIRQSNYSNYRPHRSISSAANLRQALDTTRRTRSITRYPRFNKPTSSLRSMTSVPLGSPSITRKIYQMPTKSIVGPSPFNVVEKRLISMARTGVKAVSAGSRVLASGARVVGGMAARTLVAMGPIGVAVALVAAAALAIGAVAYYFIKRNRSTIPQVVDEAINEALPVEAPVIETPDVNDVPTDSNPPSIPEEASWEGNVPWMRRPGKDLSLEDVFKLHPVLTEMAGRA